MMSHVITYQGATVEIQLSGAGRSRSIVDITLAGNFLRKIALFHGGIRTNGPVGCVNLTTFPVTIEFPSRWIAATEFPSSWAAANNGNADTELLIRPTGRSIYSDLTVSFHSSLNYSTRISLLRKRPARSFSSLKREITAVLAHTATCKLKDYEVLSALRRAGPRARSSLHWKQDERKGIAAILDFLFLFAFVSTRRGVFRQRLIYSSLVSMCITLVNLV